jgi:hypothetical protein
MRLRLPAVEFPPPDYAYAKRPGRLDGLTVGFVDGWGDGKGGPYPSMSAIERALQSRFEGLKTVWLKKANVSRQVPDPMLDDFARRVDVVVNGEGI